MDKVFFLTGPTGIGKTCAAVYLAKKINAEIVSCDSMQVYKGMEIVSSQPASSLRKIIPHHLIGILSPVEEYNVSLYRKEALKKIRQIIKKGKAPLFVGGSGLYMSVLIDGIFKAKSENKAIRQKLYRQAEALGNHFLYGKLKNVDPQAASKIHVNDTRRIVRALEVFEATGKPISDLQKQRQGLADKYAVEIFCLNMQREKLQRRIKNRVNEMFREGLAGEVRRLLDLKLSKTAGNAIGIKELKGYFDGLYGLGEAKKAMARNSCLYAKRQLTWFRKDKRINWINLEEGEKPKDIAKRIWKELY